PFKANKKGITTIIAKAPPGTTCGPGSFKKLVVRVTLPSGCQSATVKVKAKKFPLQTLQGSRSFCGDGKIDAGGDEDCDGSGCPATATCDDNCKCQPIPTTTTTTPPSTVSTTSVTTTSSTSTTTTTLIGKCIDATGHANGAACTSNLDCPTNPENQANFGCCGDGTRDFGETCDTGTDNCAVGTPVSQCASDCTSDCQAIGRCTGNGAACLDAATDCPVDQGCCGNRTVDTGETCDDGNFVGGDFCPATCFIATCTAMEGSSFGIHVTYTHPASTTIARLQVFVDYPEGQ